MDGVEYCSRTNDKWRLGTTTTYNAGRLIISADVRRRWHHYCWTLGKIGAVNSSTLSQIETKPTNDKTPVIWWMDGRERFGSHPQQQFNILWYTYKGEKPNVASKDAAPPCKSYRSSQFSHWDDEILRRLAQWVAKIAVSDIRDSIIIEDWNMWLTNRESCSNRDQRPRKYSREAEEL